MSTKNGMTRRDFTALSAVTALSFAGLGAQARAQDGTTFVIASNTELDNMDPHTALGNIPWAFFINIYDPLVRVRHDPPTIEPGLAESWTISEDGLVLTFNLRENAVFHDGSPITAQAVKYSFDRLLRLGAGMSWMIDGIIEAHGVEVVDERTVRITLSQPFAPIMQVLPWVFIVNPAIVEANKGDDDGQSFLSSNPAGSGPFELTRFEAGNLYGFTRFADYFVDGGGNVQNVIWRIVRETSSQRLLIERGEVHYVLDLTAEDMNAIEAAPGVKRVIEPTLQPFYLRMNTAHGPLTDVNLRRAVSSAFDYEGMIDVLGYADLLHGPFPANLPGHNAAMEVYRTDMERARDYLGQSAYPDGGIKLTYVYVSGYEQQRRIGLIFLDSLRQLGIDLEIKPLTWPDMVAAARSPETQSDFMAVWQSSNYADLDNFAFPAFHSSQNGNWTNPVFSDPKVDEMVVAARVGTDPTERTRIYHQMQAYVVDQATDIYCATLQRLIAHRDNLQGFSYTPIGSNAPEFFPLSLT